MSFIDYLLLFIYITADRFLATGYTRPRHIPVASCNRFSPETHLITTGLLGVNRHYYVFFLIHRNSSWSIISALAELLLFMVVCYYDFGLNKIWAKSQISPIMVLSRPFPQCEKSSNSKTIVSIISDHCSTYIVTKSNTVRHKIDGE